MSKIKTNYFKEYKEASDTLNKAELINLISSLADAYIEEKGDAFEKQNNTSDQVFLQLIVEIYANLMSIVSPEFFAECEEFLAESKDNPTDRFLKMRFIISESVGLQGRAVKEAAINLGRWLKLSPNSDHSEFQATLYNLGVEIEKNQDRILASKQNNQ